MQKLKSVLRIVDNISEWSGKIISIIIIISIVFTVYYITMRYLNLRSPWSQTLTVGKVALAYVVLGAAYILRNKSHINVDVLYNRFSLRVRGIIDVLTSSLFFLFALALLWKAIEETFEIRFSTRLLLPPYWPVSLIVVVGVSLLLLQGLAKFIRDLVIAITGKDIV
jgi:TRAP-type mannitol/chloroaromatic compound transport system permease small subunit